MTARDLLLELRAKGVEVKTSGNDRLVIDAPKGIINEELRSALSANKAELLRILNAEQAGPADAAVSQPTEPGPSAPQIASPAAKPLPWAPNVISPAAEEPVSAAPPAMSSIKHDEETTIAVSAAAEISRLEAELMRLRAEEEGRRAEVETARLAAEKSLRTEQERWRQKEEETARHRAQIERQRIEVEVREQAEEEHHRQIAEHELRRAEEELRRMRAMEEARRAEVDAQRVTAQAAHEAELAVLRRAEEENTRLRTEQERHYLETEARKRAQEDEFRRRAEARFRAVEEEIERVQARDAARLRTSAESQRLAEDVARRRAEEEARRRAEFEALRRAEEEARLRAEIEAEMRAEAEQRRKAEEQARRVAEEEARHRAQEEAQKLAAEQARRLAEAEARRRADEEARRQAEESARLIAEERARRQAEAYAQRQAEEDSRLRAEAEVRQRAELEARIRAEIEAKIRAEEAERDQAEAAHRRAQHERILAEADNAPRRTEFGFESERLEIEEPSAIHPEESNLTEVAGWFDASIENRETVRAMEPAPLTIPDDHFGTMQEDAGGEFAPVSVPESNFISEGHSSGLPPQLNSERPFERAAAISELPHFGGEEAFQHVSAAFDDESLDVRNAAARAMSELQEDRAAAFTRALREANPERRRRIGSAIASSGLANEAIGNLTSESRDETYDAFSLLFLMSKAGELKPLMRAIEEHANVEVRLAVVKLLALSGQPDILPAFRRMALRGTLPAEVRSAIIEAIYQITSQSPAEAPSMP